MKKIISPDFSQKREKTLENTGHGPFYNKGVSSINDAKGTTTGKVDFLLKIKSSKAQLYGFENPNEMNKSLWFNFFDDFSLSLKEDFISEYVEDTSLEELEKDYKMIIRYFRELFNSLYDFNDKGEKIALHSMRTYKDMELNASILVYEYLLDEQPIPSIIDEYRGIDNDGIPNMKIDMISDKYRMLYESRGHKVYRLISEYSGFFLEKFSEYEYINTLVLAVSYNAQSRIDSLLGMVSNEEDLDEYWV